MYLHIIFQIIIKKYVIFTKKPREIFYKRFMDGIERKIIEKIFLKIERRSKKI